MFEDDDMVSDERDIWFDYFPLIVEEVEHAA